MNINPDRARLDPVIVPNVPYYKAQLQVQAEVDQMQPPPRPANWGVSRHVPVVMFASVQHVRFSEFELMNSVPPFFFHGTRINLQTHSSGVRNVSVCKDIVDFTSTAT